MRLIAFGDSFVAGDILKPVQNTPAERDKINFVRKLTENYNLFHTFENHGIPGGGNEYIAYEVYRYLRENQDISDGFMLISWSGPDRFYYYNYELDRYDHALTTETKYKHKHPVFHFEMLMLGLSTLLNERNVKHAFTSSFTPYSRLNTQSKLFPNFIGREFTRNTLFDILLGEFGTNNKIPKSELFKNHDNMKHARTNQYITPCFHPTELGNELIASVLSKEIPKYL